jgi:MATE family multidrug resistance protein
MEEVNENGAQTNTELKEITHINNAITATPYQKLIKKSLQRGALTFVAVVPFAIKDILVGVIFGVLDVKTFAAFSPISSITLAANVLFNSPSAATGIKIGHDYKAQKSHDALARIVQAGGLLAIIFSLPTYGIFSSAKPLLLALNQEMAVANITQSFFWAYLPATTIYFLRYASFQIMSGLHSQIWPLAINWLNTGILCSLLTYIFALGKLGMPMLKEKGYGYALLTDQYASLFIYLLVFALAKQFKQYQFFKPRAGIMKKLWSLIKLGSPIMLAVLGEIACLISFSIMAGAISEDALVTQSIAGLYLALLVLFSQTIFQTTSILVSRAIGEKKYYDVKRYAIINSLIACSLPLITLILSCSIPNLLMSPFIDPHAERNTQIATMTRKILPIMASCEIIDGLRMSYSGALLGMQNVYIPTAVNSLIQLLISIPLMYIFGFKTNLGVLGLFVGYGLGLAILSIFMPLYFHRCNQTMLSARTSTVIVEELSSAPSQDIFLSSQGNSSSFFKRAPSKESNENINSMIEPVDKNSFHMDEIQYKSPQ